MIVLVGFQESRGKFEFVALVAADDPIVRLVNLDITLQYNTINTLISSSKRETVSLLKCFTQLPQCHSYFTNPFFNIGFCCFVFVLFDNIVSSLSL